jgi:hypothetical protein
MVIIRLDLLVFASSDRPPARKSSVDGDPERPVASDEFPRSWESEQS